jgi:hypothetical protein
MVDEAKVVIALSFFGTVTYLVRFIFLRLTSGGVSRRDSALPSVSEERFARLEQAVDAIALEVERISEGQRFTTKLLAERAQPEQQGAAARQATEVGQITPH